MLEKNSTLTALYAERNNMRGTGGSAIGEGLVVNDTLRILKLNSNDLGNMGMKNLSDGLAKNKGLTDLHVADNGYTQEGLDRLVNAVFWAVTPTPPKTEHKAVCKLNAERL